MNSLILVNNPGHYTVSGNILVSSASNSDRAVVYLALRTYVGTSAFVRGTLDYEYPLGTAYYRGTAVSSNQFNIGGSVTIYVSQDMVDAGFQLEIVTVCMGSFNTAAVLAERATSTLRIERLTYRIL